MRDQLENRLLSRFLSMEPDVWETFVNNDSETRPDEVFLVTGHILASGFTIYHPGGDDVACTIRIQSRDGILDLDSIGNRSDIEVILEPSAVRTVVETVLGRNNIPKLFTIFLEVKSSRPMQKIHNPPNDLNYLKGQHR